MVNKYCELDNTKEKLGISLAQIICNALPFFISSISFMVLIHADTVILGLYQEESEVAIYNAATRIAKLSIMIFMILNEVIMPVIVELNAKSEKEKLEYIFRVTATIAVIFSLLALLFFIFFGEYLLAVIYGEFYKAGALLLVILGVGQLITVAAGSSEIALTMMGFQKVNMYISLVTSVLAVLACVFVAPLYGSVAVVSVVAAALVLRGIVSTVFVHKFCGVRVYAKILIGPDDIKKLVRYAKY
jgi:O-antigen/teichoic acid export membrane protein